MTPLRQRMIEDMHLDLAPRTVQVYVERVAKFAQHFGKSPEKLRSADVRAYLVHFVHKRHVSWSNYNQAVCALRFVYNITRARTGDPTSARVSRCHPNLRPHVPRPVCHLALWLRAWFRGVSGNGAGNWNRWLYTPSFARAMRPKTGCLYPISARTRRMIRLLRREDF